MSQMVVNSWVTRTGNLLIFGFTDGILGNYIGPLGTAYGITSLPGSSNLQVWQNGNPVALLPPIFSTGGSAGIVSYDLLNAGFQAQPGDVWTYSAPSGWALATADYAPPVVSGTITNYVGSSIEAPFIVPQVTMPLGMLLSFGPSQGLNYGSSHVMANIIHCAPIGGANILSQTQNGFPLTISGILSWNVLNNTQSNLTDARGMPTLDGNYLLRGDELAPSNGGMIFYPSITFTGDGQGGTISNTGVIDGTIISGVEVGKMWPFTVTRNNVHSWRLILNLNFYSPSGQHIAAPFTLQNLVLLRQGDSISEYQGNVTPANNIINSLTSSNGAVPHYMRFQDVLWNADGQSSCVNSGDVKQISTFCYSTNAMGISITGLRPYDPANTPNIYMWNQYNNPNISSTNGGFAPYYTTQSGISWVAFGGLGANTWSCFEVVTPTPHGLKTGQYPILGNPQPTPNPVFYNVDHSFTSSNLSDDDQAIYITSPSSFITTVSTGQGSGGFGQLQAAQTCQWHCNINVPDNGSLPVEVCCGLASGLNTNSWYVVPSIAAYDLWLSMGNRVFNNTIPGGNIIFENGNEVWSSGPPSPQGLAYYQSLATFMGFGANYEKAYVLITQQMHDTMWGIWNSGGRGSEIKRMFSSQWANPGITTSFINYLNQYQIRADYISVGVYPDVSAAASYINFAATGLIGDILDLDRHQLFFNTAFIGKGSDLALHQAAITGYNVTYNGNPYPKPKLITYEASAQSLISNNSATTQIFNNRVHDAYFHPHVADFDNWFYYGIQIGGCEFAIVTDYSSPRDSVGNQVYVWPMYTWEGMQAGVGDGSDGKAVNQFCTTQGGSPADGLPHDGPDAVNPGNI